MNGYYDINTEERKKYAIIAIKRDKESLAKHVSIAAGAAIIVGAGALGIYYFGSEIIKEIVSEEALTAKSKFFWELKLGGITWSTIISGVGIVGVVSMIKEITGDIRDLKKDKKYLSELEEKLKTESETKGRSL